MNFSLSVRILDVLVGDISSRVVDGVSTSKYSILADQADSRPYIIRSFMEKGFKDLQDDLRQVVPTFTPLFIPACIKVLVGNEITYK